LSHERALVVGFLAFASVLAAASATWAGDTQTAERHYRVARRLAAEGSPEARAALKQVIEVDPEGPLADDALVDLARLAGLPGWPEATGALDVGAATGSLGLLDECVRRFPRGDRTEEALFLRGLVRLEPLTTYDPSAARVDLTSVATSSSTWSGRARYALAWLNEQQGNDDRAFDTYQRLLVDAPADPAGVRARVGLARILMREGEFGPAARWLQEAIDLDVDGDARAQTLRELTVRALLRQAGVADPSRLVRTRTGVRVLSGFAPTTSGGVLLGDRKQGVVVELGADGVRIGTWVVEGVQTVAVDPRGRKFAAGKTDVFHLGTAGEVTPAASLGDYTPLAQLVADGTGRLWLLERRGRRIGLVGPGRVAPELFWQGEGRRLESMIWDGRRLVAIDAKTRSVVALDGDVINTLVPREAIRPLVLAADPAGRVAILDGRSGTVQFLGANGRREAAAFASPEVPRPVAVGLGPEGELHLFETSGDWIVFR
jgi:hypothetical protein